MQDTTLRDLFDRTNNQTFPSAAQAARAVALLEEAVRKQIIDGVAGGIGSSRLTTANRRALESLLALWRPRISWTVTHSLVKQSSKPDDPFEYYRSEYTLSIVSPFEKIMDESAAAVKGAVAVGLDSMFRKGRDVKSLLVDLQSRLANIFADDTTDRRREQITNLIERNFAVKVVTVDSEDSKYFDDYFFDFTSGKPGGHITTTIPAIISDDGNDTLICRGTCVIPALPK